MNRRRHKPAAVHAALIAVAFLGSACVSAKPHGLRVGKGQTDVVYGASESPPAQGAGTTVPFVPTGDVLVGDFEVTQEGKLVPKRRPTPLPPIVACPEAAATAVPAQPAGPTVPAAPVEGRYKWKREGTIKAAGPDGTPFDRGLTGFESRALVDVVSEEGAFSFKVVQEDPRTGILMRITYRVKTGATRVQTPAASASANQGDPLGVRLVRIEYLDPETGDPIPSRTFAPSPPIPLLPLPVVQGATFAATSVDATTGVIEVAAQVVERRRVDACGDVVDGWHVKSTWRRTGRADLAYEYIIATQLGAMTIYERRDEEGESMEKADYSLAQLKPSPVGP